jgi:hypothetical protein
MRPTAFQNEIDGLSIEKNEENEIDFFWKEKPGYNIYICK